MSRPLKIAYAIVLGALALSVLGLGYVHLLRHSGDGLSTQRSSSNEDVGPCDNYIDPCDDDDGSSADDAKPKCRSGSYGIGLELVDEQPICGTQRGHTDGGRNALHCALCQWAGNRPRV